MKRFIVSFLLLTVSACATTENYEKILASWVGSSADRLVSSWGPPASAYKLSDGGQVLQYVNNRTVMTGGYSYQVPQTSYTTGNIYGPGGFAGYNGTTTTYTTETTPVIPVAMSCVTRFTVNPAGIITSWAWQGNDCKALPPK